MLASISVALGIWPDVEALMLTALRGDRGSLPPPLLGGEHPAERYVQTSYFYRNLIVFGASLVMFGFFAAAGDALRYTITGPLLELR